MKLKTKFQDEDFELGEVVEADIFYGGPESSLKVETRAAKGGCRTFYCDSLKELNELFEDYEEPKEFWFVDADGEVRKTNYLSDNDKVSLINFGNCFKSKEEAEKAVEKLKAWKRLKDNGFRFNGWTIDDGLRISICTNMGSGGIYDDDKEEIKSYLDSLFGGEE
jgi:hypothetical protein